MTMAIPQIEVEANKLNIRMISDQLPVGVNGLLMTGNNCFLSIAASRLSSEEQTVTHAVNIGYYHAIRLDAQDKQALANTWAYEHVVPYEMIMDVIQAGCVSEESLSKELCLPSAFVRKTLEHYALRNISSI